MFETQTKTQNQLTTRRLIDIVCHNKSQHWISQLKPSPISVKQTKLSLDLRTKQSQNERRLINTNLSGHFSNLKLVKARNFRWVFHEQVCGNLKFSAADSDSWWVFWIIKIGWFCCVVSTEILAWIWISKLNFEDFEHARLLRRPRNLFMMRE